MTEAANTKEAGEDVTPFDMTPEEIKARTVARLKWMKENLSPDEWGQVVRGVALPSPNEDSGSGGCPDDPDGLHHSACGCDDVDPINPNTPAEDVGGIVHRWFDQVINTCGIEYVEQVHDEYERLCSVISAQPVVKGLQPRAEAVAAFYKTIAGADENPLIPEDMDEDPCGGTGVVECWNPGGPCPSEQRASGCELCGPCRACELCGPCRACGTSSPTPRPAAPDDHGLDDERDDAWWYGPDTGPCRTCGRDVAEGQ